MLFYGMVLTEEVTHAKKEPLPNNFFLRRGARVNKTCSKIYVIIF